MNITLLSHLLYNGPPLTLLKLYTECKIQVLSEHHIIQKLTSPVLAFSPKENDLVMVTWEEKLCEKQDLDIGYIFHLVFWVC